MFKFGKVSVTASLVGLAVLGSAGGAYAYWTVTGAGQGTATVATVKPLVITPVAIKGLVIDRAMPLSGTVDNPNDFEASLLGLHLSVTPTVDSAHSGCSLSDFKIVPPTVTAHSVLGGKSVPFAGGTITLVCTAHDQAACQGATVTLDYVLK